MLSTKFCFTLRRTPRFSCRPFTQPLLSNIINNRNLSW